LGFRKAERRRENPVVGAGKRTFYLFLRPFNRGEYMINVAELLPQKYPFVMVDTLIDYTPTGLRSGYTIQADNIFAEEGVFLEGGIVEHMAQSVALHTGYAYYLRNEPAPVGYLGSISHVSVYRLPAVGETLTTRVEIL